MHIPCASGPFRRRRVEDPSGAGISQSTLEVSPSRFTSGCKLADGADCEVGQITTVERPIRLSACRITA
jgi:hypothetical protein